MCISNGRGHFPAHNFYHTKTRLLKIYQFSVINDRFFKSEKNAPVRGVFLLFAFLKSGKSEQKRRRKNYIVPSVCVGGQKPRRANGEKRKNNNCHINNSLNIMFRRRFPPIGLLNHFFGDAATELSVEEYSRSRRTQKPRQKTGLCVIPRF